MTKKQKIQASIFFIVLVFIGYIREYTFLSINLKIQQIYYKSDENKHLLPIWTNKLNNFNYTELINLKWIITLFFILIFWLLGLLILKVFKFHKKQIKLYSMAIVSLLFVSLLFFIIGDTIFNRIHFGYHIARNITGFLQSPLPILICFTLFYSIKIKQIND